MGHPQLDGAIGRQRVSGRPGPPAPPPMNGWRNVQSFLDISNRYWEISNGRRSPRLVAVPAAYVLNNSSVSLSAGRLSHFLEAVRISLAWLTKSLRFVWYVLSRTFKA